MKAWALSAELCCAAASPVCILTLPKSAPNRGSMKLRTPEGNGEPPTGLMLAAAGAGAAAGMASRWTVFFFSFSSVLAAAGLAGSVMLATLRAISRASSSAGSFGCETRANWTEAGAATDTWAGAAIEREIRAWVPWLPSRRCNACAGDTAAAALRWTVVAAAGRRSTAAGLRSPVRSCAIEHRPPDHLSFAWCVSSRATGSHIRTGRTNRRTL